MELIIGIGLVVLALGAAIGFMIWNSNTLKSLNEKLKGSMKDDK